MEALEASIPLVLFRGLKRPEAEAVRQKLELSGATAEIHVFDRSS